MSGGGGGEQTVGYKYSFGIHMGLGRGPVDEIVEVRVGDKTAWRGSQKENGQITIDKPNLFGGEEKEGGVEGTLDVFMGGSTQTIAGALSTMLGGVLPGFRRMVTTFYDGVVCANNPYPKPWKFRVRRAKAGWDGTTFEPTTAVIPIEPTDPYVAEEVPALVNMDFSLGETVTYEGNVPSAPSYSLVIKEIGTLTPEGGVWQLYGYGSYSGVYNTSGVMGGQLHLIADPLVDATGRQVLRYLIPTEDAASWAIGAGEGFYLEVNHDFNDSGSGLSSVAYVFAVGDATYNQRLFLTASSSSYSFGTSDGTFAALGSDPVARTGNNKVVVQRVGDTLSMYVNDVLQDERTYTGALGATAPTWASLGGRNDGLYLIPNDFCEGIYSSFRFSKGGSTDPGIAAMNPSHIIFECLTNREWGRGLDRTALDSTAFTSCANALFAEGFGLCLKWSRRDSIESFIQSVLDHIGATLYTSRSTGLLTLKLIRADYSFEALPLFDMETGLLEISDSVVAAPGGGANQVIVTWHDPVSDEDRTVKVDNLASIQASRGAISSITKAYPGIPSAALALRVAQRDLRVSSTTLRRYTLVMDRRAWFVEPGAAIRIKDLKRGIRDTVVRVGRVEDGTLTSGRMTITAVQDVFALPSTPFVETVVNTWVPPNTQPCLDIHRVVEAPYFMVYKSMTASELAAVDESAGYIGTMVAPGQPMNIGHEIAVRDSAPTSEDNATGTAQYCGYVP